MQIFDIHTHVLPGVDDGAGSLPEALEMLRNAVASHVFALAATPHANVPGCRENYCDEDFLNRLRELRGAAEREGIGVKILAGMEVRLDDRVPQLLREKKLLALNGSRYLLSELPVNGDFAYADKQLRHVLDAGFVPIVAHPERYYFVWDEPERTEQWLEMGCHLQLTAGSILGRFGRESKHAAQVLLQRDLTACVASDAHGLNRRTNFMADIYQYLTLHYSEIYARMLLWENPLAICQNKEL